MLAKKCDRCGKLYEHYDIIDNTKKNGIAIVFTNKFGGRERWNGDIDLCRDCMNSFTKWLEEEKDDASKKV